MSHVLQVESQVSDPTTQVMSHSVYHCNLTHGKFLRYFDLSPISIKIGF